MSEGSQLHRPHPLSQFRSNRRNKRDEEPISDNKNLQAAFDQLTRRQSSSSTTPRISESSDAGSFLTASTSLHSPTSSNNNSNTSFTQRRMERGGNVPCSFSSFEWERPTKSGLSSSAGSSEYDSSAYYGLSPFVTSSFIDVPVLERSGNNNNRYRSLSQRYQRERNKGGGSTPGESDDPLSPDHRTLSSSITTRSTMSGKKGREDSDIELSDDEGKRGSGVGEGGGSDMLFQMEDGHSSKSHHFDLMDPHSYEEDDYDDDDDDDDTKTERAPSSNNSRRGTATFGPGSRCLYDLISTPSQPIEHDDEDEEDEDDDIPPVRPEFARIKHMLTSYRPIPKQHDEKENQQQRQHQHQQQQRAQVGKLQHPAPRRHLLQTPVFQVVNSNTVKDRYLFLFNDLLLICKPIMDENIIDNASVLKGSNTKDGSNGSGKYRFRHNENSLFQVKNIVELSKVTLYLPRDEQQHQQSSNHRPSMMMDRDGRMSMQTLPPPRKMHPVLATALHKFEEDPTDGIAYLVEKQVLANEPLSIANFLFKTPDLSRRQLGNYVSEPENSDIYDAFLDCFRMVALRLDEALRILLMTLRLPSNWDALEYTIERFAKKWHDANQNVVKFHEDMVVKVVVAMLFLNAEFWYDADRNKDVFWHAREHKERRDRQRLLTRRASMIDRKDERGSVAIEPLHYISARRAKEGSTKPSLEEFLDRWRYYDQYTLVPVEFLRDMYQSIASERLETGWDNGNNTTEDDEDESIAPAQDTIITVTPHRFPTSLIKGVPSIPISITIPAPDPGLQIKLRGQDLVCEPSVLDFTDSCVQTFTITGHTLGRTSLMFIKSGFHASRYVSPSLPRTKSIVVERPFMRYTFQIGFSHADPRAIAAAAAGLKSPVGSPPPPPSQLTVSTASAAATTPTANTTTTSSAPPPPPTTTSATATGDDEPPMVKRKYTFSVESDQERKEWLRHLKDVCGHVYIGGGTTSTGQHVKRLSSEERVALQVLKEVLLADEFKKGTANVTALSKVWGRSSMIDVTSQTNSPAKEVKDGDHLWVMQSPVKEDLVFLEGNTNNNTVSANNNADKKNDDAASTKTADRSSIVTTTKSTANVVTKRGHEIIKLVVQNSMVPLMLGFLRKQIPKD